MPKQTVNRPARSYDDGNVVRTGWGHFRGDPTKAFGRSSPFTVGRFTILCVYSLPTGRVTIQVAGNHVQSRRDGGEDFPDDLHWVDKVNRIGAKRADRENWTALYRVNGDFTAFSFDGESYRDGEEYGPVITVANHRRRWMCANSSNLRNFAVEGQSDTDNPKLASAFTRKELAQDFVDLNPQYEIVQVWW